MDEIKFDRKNYRKHSDNNKKKIAKSLEECGAGRSIVIDNEGEIIAGNGVYEQAQKAGMKVKVVETDGTELVVVKRTDLQTEDERRRLLAMADNATADRVEWDLDTLQADFGVEELNDWGIKIPNTAKLSGTDFHSMYYEPKQQPDLSLEDCVDLRKFQAKIKALDEYNLTEEQKERLRLFAYRFIKINFEAVANYYAFNATEEEQKAIERLRLVLVDGGSVDGFIEDELLRVQDICRIEEEEGDDD